MLTLQFDVFCCFLFMSSLFSSFSFAGFPIRTEDPEAYKMTGMLLSYEEKDDGLPWSINRKIQRMMHYEVSLKPFEATIMLPPEEGPNGFTTPDAI